MASQPGFCKFSSLTLIPIELSAVEVDLLSPQEIAWLDDYHRQVWETLSPRVNEATRQWLEVATRPLGESHKY